MYGRLAPSPTGRLHVGNMSAFALAAVQASHERGALLLRIEDLDPPRCVPGAAERHVDTLHWLGITWRDGPDVGGPHAPYRQSERAAIYEEALNGLAARGLVYPCSCSRRDVQEALSAPHHDFDPALAYPGTCRQRNASAFASLETDASIRFAAEGSFRFDDVIWGPQEQDISVAPGDFVVRRRDGLFAYQFAVVLDDALMGVTHVVRGVDLLQSTPPQLALFAALGAPPPSYMHAPLLVDAGGQRLAKRDGAIDRVALEARGWTGPDLLGALAVLWGWTPRFESHSVASLAALWAPERLRRRTIVVPDALLAGPDAFAAWVRAEPRTSLEPDVPTT